MSIPYIGEIRIASFPYEPVNWAECNGQLLAVSAQPVLFSLLGTAYGGDGVLSFALPDLRGRIPLHRSFSRRRGDAGGEDFVTLAPEHLPKHTHALRASTERVVPTLGAQNPTGRLLASAQASLQGGGIAPVKLYGQPQNLQPMNVQAVTGAGLGQQHYNMMPYMTLNFIIALTGINPYPVFTPNR